MVCLACVRVCLHRRFAYMCKSGAAHGWGNGNFSESKGRIFLRFEYLFCCGLLTSTMIRYGSHSDVSKTAVCFFLSKTAVCLYIATLDTVDDAQSMWSGQDYILVC